MRIATKSADETIAVGERLGKMLKPGDVVALSGDLGAGKTTLTRGIALGLGVTADIHSPTFTLVHEHPGPTPLYHIDVYRLSDEQEAEFIGIDDYVYGDGVTIVEWAETIKSLLPAERLEIELKMTGDNDRELVFAATSPRLRALLERLKC